MKVDVLEEYFQNSSEELEKVNFYSSQYVEIENEHFFVQSGMHCLNQFLISELNSKSGAKPSFYIDFSSILSTIEDRKLADYLVINNCGKYFDIKSIKSNYFKIYTYLKKTGKGIYYHPRFFRNPSEPCAYISKDADLTEKSQFANDFKDSISEELILEERIEIKDVYYTKTYIDLSYNDFVKKADSLNSENDNPLLERQKLLHYYLKKFFLGKVSNLSTYLLSVPLIGSPSYGLDVTVNSPAHYSGQGAVFILIVSQEEIIDSILENIAIKISYLLKDITYNYLVDVGLNLLKNSVKNATKSAIAAIMSRNMSHNLGSHVLFYLKNIIGDTPKQLEHLLHELENKDGKYVLTVLKKYREKYHIETAETPEQIKAPFLRGLSRFIGYLQERQDFIATIANDFIPYFGSINFKDFIYDELNPDLRVKRHSAEEKYSEKNILLDYIAKSEGYTRDNIKIFFKEFSGYVKDHRDLKKLRKVNIDLPGGILGRQAFFSILENFIRNVAKHSINDKKQLDIVIDMELYGNNKQYYKVELYEKHNLATTENLKKIQNAIDEPYVGDTGKIKPGNKGIKEIRISAAWMRGLSVAEIDEKKPNKENERKSYPILEVFKRNIKNDNGANSSENVIAYRFYIPTSKKMVLVTDKAINDDKSKLNDYQNIKEADTIFQIKNYKTFKEFDTNYNLILYDNDFPEIEKEKIKELSPTRCMEVNLSSLNTTFKKYESANKVYLFYYEKWINQEFQDILTEFQDKAYILVSDKTNGRNVKDNKIGFSNADFSELKSGEDYAEKNLSIFRTHNDTKKEFEEFEKTELYKKAKFIEGISGHNSTDRLIRRETLDKEWRLKMTESAYTSVLIIDERIYDRISEYKPLVHLNYKSKDIPISSVNELLKFFKEKETDYQLDKTEYYKLLLKLLNDEKDYKLSYYNKKIIELRDKLYKELLTFKNSEVNIPEQDIKNNEYKKALYNKKNIEIFNILIDKHKVLVKNLLRKEEISILADDLMKKDKETEPKNSFDFVVIHQGILDKIYDQCIPNNSDVKQDKDQKQEPDYRQTIFDNLSKYFPAKYKYIIHSGRSLPEFLPNKTSFVQFSSIEAALFDCKYSLTELLYSARFELKENKH